MVFIFNSLSVTYLIFFSLVLLPLPRFISGFCLLKNKSYPEDDLHKSLSEHFSQAPGVVTITVSITPGDGTPGFHRIVTDVVSAAVNNQGFAVCILFIVLNDK